MKKRLLVVLVLVLALGFAFANGFAEDYKVYAAKVAKADESTLKSWYDDSYARNQLVDFM